MSLQVPSQSEVIALAGRIPLRDVLTEMHLVGADLDRGTNVVVNAPATVVALVTAQESLVSTGLRRA
jgi:hypothetical protein